LTRPRQIHRRQQLGIGGVAETTSIPFAAQALDQNLRLLNHKEGKPPLFSTRR
jgi:hypothetical protein